MRILLVSVLFAFSIPVFAGFTEYIEEVDSDLQYDLNYCASVAKNFVIGQLKIKNLMPHNLKAEVFPFSENIYYVTVSTEVINDALIEKGPDYAYNCFRCADLEMVVSQESYEQACSTKE